MIHNNSHINVENIGGNTDQEGLLCHTDNNVIVTGGWYYPNGSRIPDLNQTQNNYSLIASTFYSSISESAIRLFYHGPVPALTGGKFCCQILDKEGSNVSQCVTVGKQLKFKC